MAFNVHLKSFSLQSYSAKIESEEYYGMQEYKVSLKQVTERGLLEF